MIRLWTLGSLDLRDGDDREIRPILSQPKRLALLAYLAISGSREFHRRDELLGVFWPEQDQERARAALSRAIYYLRQSLGSSVIVSRGDDAIALASDALWCDAAAFEEATDAKDYARALALYRGDFLTGFFVSDLRGLEHWLESQRTRLKTLAARAAGALADAEDTANNSAAAIARAEQAVALAPFDEPAFRRYLALLDRSGDRAGAVRAYEEFSRRIALELDLTPAPETRALVDTIRERTQTIAPTAPLVFAPPNGVDGENGTSSAAPVAPPRSPRVRRASILAIGLGLVVVVAGAMAMRWTRPLERDRVVVAVFANRTGDSTLDPLGALAADIVTQGLVQTGLVPKVAQPVALVMSYSNGASDVAEIERIGRRSRAATVVAGAFYRDGDSIRFNARIVDLERRHVVWAVPPVVTTTDSTRRAIERMAQRTTGAVAVLMDPRYAPWFPIASAPPMFTAFQEHVRGVEAQRLYDHTTAVKHYRRAIEIDTSFVWARVELAMAYRDLFKHAVADSIADFLNETRDKATPLLRHWLDWMQAMRAEDYVRAHRVMKRAAALAPDRFRLSLAQAADRINRPSEALATLDSLGPKSSYSGGSPDYWKLLTKTLHQLGRHQRELEAARQAQRGNLENVRTAVGYELRALAALGQADAVRARLDKVFAFAREDSRDVRLWEYRGITMVLIEAAEELRAHGHPDVATRAIDDLIAWHRALPATEASRKERRGELGRALYAGRRWDEAERVFRTLKHDFPDDVVNIGFLGAIAAQRGDRARAEQVIAELERRKPTAVRRDMQTSFWQAQISALLGDRAEAVRHIVDVTGQEGRYIHPLSDLEVLRGYGAFEELFRPKG